MHISGRFYRTWLDKEVVTARKELSRAEAALKATEHKVRKIIRESQLALLEKEGEVTARISLPSLVKELAEAKVITWRDFVNGLQPMFPSQGCELKGILRDLKVIPNVSWYPISGADFSPLALSEIYEFSNQRLLKLSSIFHEGESTLLWLNDPLSDHIKDVIPQEEGVEYSSFSNSLYRQFMSRHDLKDGRVSEVRLRAERRESYLINEKIPIHLFLVECFQPDYLNGPYIVLFTSANSANLFQEVFYPLRLRIKSVFLGRNTSSVARHSLESAIKYDASTESLCREFSGRTASTQRTDEVSEGPNATVRLSDLLIESILARSFDGLDRFRQIPRLLRMCERTLGPVDYYFLDQTVFSQETLTPRLWPIKHYQHLTSINGIGSSQIGVFSRPNALAAPF